MLAIATNMQILNDGVITLHIILQGSVLPSIWHRTEEGLFVENSISIFDPITRGLPFNKVTLNGGTAIIHNNLSSIK